MGEYATHNGQHIKIGTCEDLYYLRYDQAEAVEWEAGDLLAPDVLSALRFRFPFPDEDDVEPGAFGDHGRGVEIPGWRFPDGYCEHYSVQFTASAGYVLSIPCPEQFGQPGLRVELPDGLVVHRNGFRGGPKVVQQGIREGVLRTIIECGACGAKASLSTEAAADVVGAFTAEAERTAYRRDLDGWGYVHPDDYRAYLVEIARRIMHGYTEAVAA